MTEGEFPTSPRALIDANPVLNFQAGQCPDWCTHFHSESALITCVGHVESFSRVVFPREGTEGLLWEQKSHRQGQGK